MHILNPNLFNTFFLSYILKYNFAARDLGSFDVFFVTIGCERYQVAVQHVDV